MSEFPISCVLCRRKKIKCNKRKPCNQCSKKGTYCEFPEKFRNISIKEEDDTPKNNSENSSSSTFPSGGSRSPLELNKLNDEIELLRKEKLAVLHENFKLSQRNHELKGKLQAASRTSNSASLDHGFEISGETTELGRKYYGPQLSNYMIEALRLKDDDNNGEDASEKKENPHPLSVKLNQRINSDDTDIDNDEVAVSKKPLPWVVESNESPRTNVKALINLVELFFSIPSYQCFISKVQMIDFINLHHAIKDAEWENDDDLILLHMILILAVQRITPLEYNQIGLSLNPVPLAQELYKRTNKLIKKSLYRGFTALRHNLLNESIVTVQAYILCTEWYFIDQKYEESWSMMFHCCAVAYSIGLHVMVTMRTTNSYPDGAPLKIAEISKDEDGKSNEKNVNTEANGSDEDDDEDYDVPRIKVWFALKNISGELCSVLGRPNPILIQVNLVVLMTSTSSSVAKMDLEKNSTQVQLKIGLSECLRLSNMMLIESFMMNFTMDDVVRLDNRFKKEAEILSWFVSDQYQQEASGRLGELNEWSHVPVYVDRTNAVGDLIALYINRAKLLEPFLNQFDDDNQSKYLFDSICESVVSFLDYVCDFVLHFLTEETQKYLNDDGSVGSRLRLGKAFRTKYPFINSFIYQGVIVVFTLLNYRAKEFIVGEHNEFLQQVGTKLNTLMQFDSKVSSIIQQGVHLWSTNIVYLINKDIQHVNMLLSKAEQYRNEAIEKKAIMNEEFDRILADTFDINMKDPFWFTNPDSIPHYLSSPSDDGSGLVYDQGPEKSTTMHLQSSSHQTNDSQTLNQGPYQPQPHSVNMFARDQVNNFDQYNQWDPRPDSFEPFQNNHMNMNNQQLQNQAINSQPLDGPAMNNLALRNQTINSRGINSQVINNQGMNGQGMNGQGMNNQGMNNQGMNNQSISNQNLDRQRINSQTINNPGINNAGQPGLVRVDNVDVEMPQQMQPPMQNQPNVYGDNYVKMTFQMDDAMDTDPVKIEAASELDYANSKALDKEAFMQPNFPRPKK